MPSTNTVSKSASAAVNTALQNNNYATSNSQSMIGGTTIYGRTPSVTDWQGKTYNDLTNRERRLARRGVDVTSFSYEHPEIGIEENELGGDTGTSFSNLAGLFGNAATVASPLIGNLFGNNIEDEGFKDEQSAAKFASNFGPWGAFAGGIASISSQVSRGLDVNTSKISDRAKEASGMKGFGKFANNTLNWINNTTFGLWGGFGAIPKTQDYAMSQEAEMLSGAYSGTTSDMRAAQDVAGGRFFFGRGKLNNLVDQSVKNDQLMTAIGINNQNKISSVPYSADDLNSQYINTITGRTRQNYTTKVGKQGMKMLSKEELNKIYSARKAETSDISKLQNGGSILIPDGALHAHKHHMEDTNPELAEELTKKGIPVITTDENGEVKQVAEIEREEITLSSELTAEIEKLWKSGEEDDMIKAGKLIVDALFNDSTDNAGLIDKVE